MSYTKKTSNMKLLKLAAAATFLLLNFVDLSLSKQKRTPCFVRNCPTGGKRSFLMIEEHPARKCLSCQAKDSGRSVAGICISNDTCCVDHLGCFVDTEESKVCAPEDDFSTPCTIVGPKCGSDGQGICVVSGFCCIERRNCRPDPECK